MFMLGNGGVRVVVHSYDLELKLCVCVCVCVCYSFKFIKVVLYVCVIHNGHVMWYEV